MSEDETIMPGHDIIVVGASAGGVEAAARLVRDLPPDLPAAVFIVIHFPGHATSVMPRILNNAGTLPAAHAEDGEPIRHGRIYVARPDHHLLVERGRVRVVRGPKENHQRPAVDPLFRSAAAAYGPQVVGVVLSGSLDDGTAGLLAIKRRGGVAVVQDPQDALVPGMPSSALEHVDVDHCEPLSEIGPLLARIAGEPARNEGDLPMADGEMRIETKAPEFDLATIEADDHPGQLSALTCPDCKGPLWEIRDGSLLRFRCRTGHGFTTEGMLAGKADAVEEALWVALNNLEESALMARRLAGEARERGHERVAQRFEERDHAMKERAATVRGVLLGSDDELPPLLERNGATAHSAG